MSFAARGKSRSATATRNDENPSLSGMKGSNFRAICSAWPTVRTVFDDSLPEDGDNPAYPEHVWAVSQWNNVVKVT